LNAYHGRTDYAEQLRGAPGLTVRLRGAYAYADLPKILAGIDILVVPSIWWETFGLTAREGALAGVPVVVADVGGLHDVVKSGLALGFRAGDAEDLARVLLRLIEDKALRAEMSRKAHLVRDIADCAAETEAHYETVLARLAR
jgi:glycosyltransferase involved in cell wall biosynthesis